MSALDEVVLHCQMAADGNNDLQWANEAAVELAALRRERDALREALRPFADAAYDLQGYADFENLSDYALRDIKVVTVGDLRRAAALLAKGEQG